MAISFTKIFKKDTEKAEDKKLVGQPASSEAQQAEETKTAKKHGEPGFCCGSCS
ncbi:CCGSCS motif protein [Photobacterium sp. ZSDE20]|uniref:CCGSCS motif protein n=1 Tax=Photobacterium pectinilyticum TaxID=2906793 RepID=A0ABT1N6B1_9GAMM|nr:CCGSCS motif protein [Photobacterium sp. ZSDE20]MCQ1060077.1 CCGSCS motif protein [Photobacterium sp. ZSDE20]MDD1827256.1 CCGSCS motif protein [Photobacterium sp. ZSDE20]